MTQPNNEAQFWKLKYFELLQHTTQVMSLLAGPSLRPQLEAQAEALRARAAAKDTEPKKGAAPQ